MEFVLIVSQYSYSRNMHIVKFDEATFLENAKSFARELMPYKRGNTDSIDDKDLGDLTYEHTDKIRMRYNINDHGDIYFIRSDYANRLMEIAGDYRSDTDRESRGYQKKELVERISNRHSSYVFRTIVERHFELA